MFFEVFQSGSIEDFRVFQSPLYCPEIISQAQSKMRPSGIEPDSPRWQRDVLTDVLWPRMTLFLVMAFYT